MEATQLNEKMKQMVEKTCNDGFNRIEKMKQIVEKTCNDGYSRMANMPMCENLYNDMIRNGYVEQAISFKNLVFYTTVLEPQLTDRQIIEKILKRGRQVRKKQLKQHGAHPRHI